MTTFYLASWTALWAIQLAKGLPAQLTPWTSMPENHKSMKFVFENGETSIIRDTGFPVLTRSKWHSGILFSLVKFMRYALGQHLSLTIYLCNVSEFQNPRYLSFFLLWNYYMPIDLQESIQKITLVVDKNLDRNWPNWRNDGLPRSARWPLSCPLSRPVRRLKKSS